MMDDGGETELNWFRRQTPLGLTIKVVAVFLGIALCAGVGNYVFGWFGKAADVVSPDNVEEQWRFAYDFDKSLTAAATNWCTAKNLEDDAPPADKSERQSQTAARAATYESIRAQYDARLADAFRAKLVKPSDVPDQAPMLEEKVAQLGCYKK